MGKKWRSERVLMEGVNTIWGRNVIYTVKKRWGEDGGGRGRRYSLHGGETGDFIVMGAKGTLKRVLLT